MAVLLTVFESDYLYRIQEQNLFLHTSLFLRQCMVASGGLLTWMGAYLTQYLYYPLLGAGLLCLLWAFLMLLLKRAFRITDEWMPMTLVPVACLLTANTCLGYWIYFLKLRGYFFDATIGMLVATGLTWVYRSLPRKAFLPTLFIWLATSVGYVLFGFYGLWGSVLMGLMAWRMERYRVADSLSAVVAVIAVPLVCYHALYHETNIVNVYWTGLPVFSYMQQRLFAYYIPYIVMLGSTGMMAAGYQRMVSAGEPPTAAASDVKASMVSAGEPPTATASDVKAAMKKEQGCTWLVRGVLGLTLAGVVVFWYKDDNFHRELSMWRSVEQQDWTQVLATAAKVKDEPTRSVCMMQNLALARLGRQGEEMFRYPNGKQRPDAPFPVRLVHTVGRQLYLQYGVPNYCYRWCMEDGVEYGWTVEKLKLMVKCSLLNGELEAARQYLLLLRTTDFHRAWAGKYIEYVHNPELIRKDPELQTIMKMQRRDNFLTADQAQMEQFLLEHFCTAEPLTPLLHEQMMIAAMQTKNMPLFWKLFYRYTELHRGQRAPRHYQEAACLFGHLNRIDMSHTSFDPMVVSDYESFAGIVGRYQQQGMTAEQIAPLVRERFCHTYYYDFYFNHYNYIEP